MQSMVSRRVFLGTLAAAGAGLSTSRVFAQGGGLLEQLRKAGVARLGFAQQPPFSELLPDGSVGGLAPTVTKLILEKLGIPKVTGIIAPYGQLIPGLQAGRWDMIGACLNITKARCAQVRYSDPIVFDGAAFGYLRADAPTPPKSIAEWGRSGTKVGVLAGGYLVAPAQAVAGAPANVVQFPDNPALIDGLLARRVNVALAAYSAMRDLKASRKDAFEIVYPLEGDNPTGSAPAFRSTDTDLFDAYQRELRALRKSGEFFKISERFGFDMPANRREQTNQQACDSAA